MQHTITKFISYNYCNGETNIFCTEDSIKGYPNSEQLEFYKARLNEGQIEELDTENLSVYEIHGTSWAVRNFLRESFGYLLKAMLTASGDDTCFDYLPAAIDEFFSVLQTFTKSDNPDIQKGLSSCNLDLWASLYDIYMQKVPGYIDTEILTWEQGMTQTPRFPAILI